MRASDFFQVYPSTMKKKSWAKRSSSDTRCTRVPHVQPCNRPMNSVLIFGSSIILFFAIIQFITVFHSQIMLLRPCMTFAVSVAMLRHTHKFRMKNGVGNGCVFKRYDAHYFPVFISAEHFPFSTSCFCSRTRRSWSSWCSASRFCGTEL